MRKTIYGLAAAGLAAVAVTAATLGTSAHAAKAPATATRAHRTVAGAANAGIFGNEGGGCANQSVNGYREASCISAQGTNVLPEYYITNLPVSNCTVWWAVWHNGAIVEDASSLGACAIGHVSLPSIDLGLHDNAGDWETEVKVIDSNGTTIIDNYSPSENM